MSLMKIHLLWGFQETVPVGDLGEIYFGANETSETTNIPGYINLPSLHSQRPTLIKSPLTNFNGSKKEIWLLNRCNWVCCNYTNLFEMAAFNLVSKSVVDI